MRKRIKCLKVYILSFILMIGGAACMNNPKNIDVSNISTSVSQQIEVNSFTNITEPIETSASEYNQIVEAIYSEIYGYNEGDKIDYADKAMSCVVKLPDRFLGRITSEEDVKEKAEMIWCEIDRGQFEYIKDTHESQKQPYIEAVFYEKYDVWLVKTIITGIKANGERYILTGAFSSIIQNSDGEVLAVYFG